MAIKLLVAIGIGIAMVVSPLKDSKLSKFLIMITGG